MKLKNIIISTTLLCIFLISSSFYSMNSSFTKKLIRNYLKSSNEGVYALKAYYFGKYYVGDELQAYTDAFGTFISLGHNYIIPLNSLVFIPENIRKPNRHENWKNVVDKHVASFSVSSLESKTDLPPSVNNLLNAYRRLEIHGPLNHNITREFIFSLNDNHNNKKALIITPKKDNLFSGIIYFNNELTIDSLFFDKCRWFCEVQQNMVFGWLKVNYASFEKNTYPVIISGGYKTDEIELTTKLVVTAQNAYNINIDSNNFNDVVGFSGNPILIYNAEEWLVNDSFLLQTLDSSTYQYLNNTTIQKQVKNNSGELYYRYVYDGVSEPDIKSPSYQRMIQHIKKGLVK
jgi:hypothetical protein